MLAGLVRFRLGMSKALLYIWTNATQRVQRRPKRLQRADAVLTSRHCLQHSSLLCYACPAQMITTRRRSPDIQALPTTLLPSMLSLSGPNDNNAQAQSWHPGTAYKMHDAVDRAPRLTVHALIKDEWHGKHKLNTTKINRKQCPDTGIEPETSDMPGKRAAFTPPWHLCFLMHYPTISTHRWTILYDLRCNAGGARPITVRNE